MRINQPAGWYYSTEALRKTVNIWEKHGSGLTNMHGSTATSFSWATHDRSARSRVFDELQKIDFDIGGSGLGHEDAELLLGQSRCEWACYDTMAAAMTSRRPSRTRLHRPAFPYKYKFKFSGCPNDCVASIARADMSIIGTWRDAIQVDKAAVSEYAKDGMDIQADVVANCPAKCMEWDGKELEIDNSYCRSLHALHQRHAQGAATGQGSGSDRTARVQGARSSRERFSRRYLIPFYKMEPPYQELKDIVERIWDVWSEEGKNRERVGEFIQRVGMGNFLEAIELEPVAEMVAHPA